MSDIILDKPPVPIAQEVAKTPETSVIEVINDVEVILKPAGHLREAGSRMSICGIATDLVARAAENRGVKAEKYQMHDVYLGFGGKVENSTRHEFDTVAIGGKNFLVDESFCQFIDPKTGDVGDVNLEEGRQVFEVEGNLATSPLASALLDTGYVELTDEVLREYLRLLCGVVDDMDISVQGLKIIEPLEYDHTAEELDGLLRGQISFPRKT